MSKIRNERGSTTIAAAGFAAAILGLAWLCMVVATTVVHTHQARNAADIAAVAAASALYVSTAPCPVAADFAAKNYASLEDCQIDGADVVVTVRVDQVSARARAGPL